MAYCEVGLNTQDCEAPIASRDDEGEPGALRTRCRACGQPACKSCSTVQTYAGRRRTRVCNDCVGHYQDEVH